MKIRRRRTKFGLRHYYIKLNAIYEKLSQNKK